jgi:hypothetical protein
VIKFLISAKRSRHECGLQAEKVPNACGFGFQLLALERSKPGKGLHFHLDPPSANVALPYAGDHAINQEHRESNSALQASAPVSGYALAGNIRDEAVSWDASQDVTVVLR